MRVTLEFTREERDLICKALRNYAEWLETHIRSNLPSLEPLAKNLRGVLSLLREFE